MEQVETKSRSVLKSVSWRITATLTTVVLVLLFSGETELALTIGGIEIVSKLAIYYAHERAWGRIKYGLRG